MHGVITPNLVVSDALVLTLIRIGEEFPLGQFLSERSHRVRPGLLLPLSLAISLRVLRGWLWRALILVLLSLLALLFLLFCRSSG